MQVLCCVEFYAKTAMAFCPSRVFSSLFLYHLFLLFWLCLFFFCVGVIDASTKDDAQGAANDVRGLIQFKKCITRDPLSLLKNWDDSAAAPNACNWTGITCSTKHSGRVMEINLRSATLRGSLSPQLSNLSFLQSLDISNNSLSGTIPPSLGILLRLKTLNLCMNEFQDRIPFQLGNLSSLQFLYVCANSLSGEIPESLARLQGLIVFNFYQNHLGGHVPSWLGELRRLELLDLGENNFHGIIPAQLGNLSSSSMTFLALASNYLTGFIPCSFASLYRLTHLYLYQNNLTGTIPHCLSNLTALTDLGLFMNNLQGSLPAWVGNFNKLHYLALAFNKLTGNFPESWQNLTQLQDLQLSGNRLLGTPPLWLGTLCTQLKRLNLGSNYFTSGVNMHTQPIPILKALSNCSQLIYLGIYYNHLTGTLPPKFGGSLPKLQRLGLEGNFISGNIPGSVENLSSVVELSLFDNVFSGNIPPQIANLKSVQIIRLQTNKLQGSIPTEISLLNKSLGYLSLSQNKLSGCIPASIGKLINLRKLYLDGNLLSGKIPPEIGNCPAIEDLVLSSNNLSGPIPQEVAGITSIVFHFDLSANVLTGEVPAEISRLQMAQFINLSGNHLSGSIASYIESWLDAREINLTFNDFSGNLSKSIGNKLTQLQSIDLARNNFTGPVPASLLNHSTLKFLNFSYNNFNGEVQCLHSSFKKLRLTRLSFLGNPNLCGGCFGLNACPGSPMQHSSPLNKGTILKIVLAIVGLLLLLVVAGILFIIRRVITSQREIPRIGENFLKISEEELQRATNNFSTSNLVGEGSHGKVYRGVLASGMVVAVKCFSSETQIGTEKSFKKECHTLGKVKHRNILKLISVVWSEELKALVMPFMSNGNLHSLLHGRQGGQLIPLELSMRVKILTELAQGLAYLHHDCEFQVIHCDIKPENVLLDEDMTIKLSDFGISSLIGDFDCPTPSSSLAVRGSVGYIAPEYGTGERISVKGDVYSFGVVTLEVMTRLKPTHEMFSGSVTLPLWISMALKGKSSDERRAAIKNIIMTTNEGGRGINMDKDDEMSVMESILMLGLRCTCHNASMRPSMKEVESFVQSAALLLNPQDQRTLPRKLEEVINMVESQPPLLPRREKAESSTFSS